MTINFIVFGMLTSYFLYDINQQEKAKVNPVTYEELVLIEKNGYKIPSFHENKHFIKFNDTMLSTDTVYIQIDSLR